MYRNQTGGKTHSISLHFGAMTRNQLRKLTHEEITGLRLPVSGLENAQRAPVWGILDNVRSLYNVGSIFRTSDAALISGLMLCGYTPEPPRKEIEKTALGATMTVPWEHFDTTIGAVIAARKKGARICVLEQTSNGKSCFDLAEEKFPVCLVVGNELTGVHPEVVHQADMAIEIPMHGTKHSLNVAVAYGIAIYQLVHTWQRQQAATAEQRARG